jgi:hypothetical protein
MFFEPLFRSRREPESDKRLQKYQCHPVNLIDAANGSAARLVNLLARDFDCFRDEHAFDGRRKPIRILKRAQILAADLWACFEGEAYGEFWDIDKITMFADYRVPQILNSMGCLTYCPPLNSAIQERREIPSGGSWEVQLRGKHALSVARLFGILTTSQHVPSGAWS